MTYTDRFKDAPWLQMTPPKILVGGVGGIGSNMLYYMTKTIPGTYYLFDNDVVESHNVGTQFFTLNQIGRDKVAAIKETLNNFSRQSSIQVFTTAISKNDGNIMPITISAFDNMLARKDLFHNWKQQSNREIFIDGRLSANIYQVFVVVPGREEWYEKTLFNDEDVPNAPCTFKQTAYFGGLIGARMTHVLVNYLSNKAMGEEIMNIPYLIEENGDPFIIKIYYNEEDI